jgi:hypothetical protein
MLGSENSAASSLPAAMAAAISAGGSCTVVTPSWAMTCAPRPKKRMRRPRRLSTERISRRNQPEASGGIMAQGMLCTLRSANMPRASSSPPP